MSVSREKEDCRLSGVWEVRELFLLMYLVRECEWLEYLYYLDSKVVINKSRIGFLLISVFFSCSFFYFFHLFNLLAQIQYNHYT